MARKQKVVETQEPVVEVKHPHFHARLSRPVSDSYPEEAVARFQETYGPNLGYVVFGEIYGDEKRRFRDGTSIRTSLVRKEEEIDGVRYIHTLNTVYRVE